MSAGWSPALSKTASCSIPAAPSRSKLTKKPDDRNPRSAGSRRHTHEGRCRLAGTLHIARIPVQQHDGEAAVEQQQHLPRQRLPASAMPVRRERLPAARPRTFSCARRRCGSPGCPGMLASSADVRRKPHPFHFGCRAARARLTKIALDPRRHDRPRLRIEPSAGRAPRFGWSRPSR